MFLVKIFAFLALPIFLFASNLDFTLHKKGEDKNESILLVIGGIQGDEPGGFNAASLLVTHYKITKGSVWVVPNLNFNSIVERSRGLFGDLNRKFAHIEKDDPEYSTIERIKSAILDERVDMVLNLHDGSGFYRDSYIDEMRNPNRWGQSCIVDQEQIEHEKYGELSKIAEDVKEHVNKNLLDSEHIFGVRNTRTSEGDEEMAKSLTYFAIQNNKPAFGIEGSKSFDTPFRTYYHLLALERYMQIMGIEYERGFEMSPVAIKNAIEDSAQKVVLYDNKFLLPIKDVRNYLKFIPVKKDSDIEYTADHPLLAIVKKDKDYRIYYGNKGVASLSPEYLEYDDSLNTIDVNIDGSEKVVSFGSMIDVKSNFLVKSKKGYRVNIIGFLNPKKTSEADIIVKKSNIMNSFSVDKKERIYRVEIYKDDKFSGMFLVNFDEKATTNSPQVASIKE
ncbi:MAG: hypothetical protein QG567_1872 [Campylobacterota bacterium]|nr:hypothetical protein [Campylobacterota bacterium]